MTRRRRYRRKNPSLLPLLLGFLIFFGLISSSVPAFLVQINFQVLFQILISIGIAVIFLGGAGYLLYRLTKNRIARESERKRFRFIVTLQEMRRMDPTVFEHYVAWLFKEQGYEATVTPPSGDEGIDAFLTRKEDGRIIRTALQMKRYKEGHAVPSKEVREFVGSYKDVTDHGIFITTSSYTTPALLWASTRDVELIDGHGLIDMAEVFGVPGKYRTSGKRERYDEIAQHLIVNKEVIRDARKKGCIDDWEEQFALDIMDEESLSPKQQVYRNEIHSKVTQCA